jgi:hypothetical protein
MEAGLGETVIELTAASGGELPAAGGWTTPAHPDKIETASMAAIESATEFLSVRHEIIAIKLALNPKFFRLRALLERVNSCR